MHLLLCIIFLVLLLVAFGVAYALFKKNARIETENKQLKEKVEKTEEREDDFHLKLIGMLSHDFRGLFGNIVELMKLYRRGDLPPQKLPVLLGELDEHAQRHLSTYDDVLEWVKTQLNAYHFKPVPVRAVEVVEDAVKAHLFEIKRKGINLTVKEDEPSETIQTDNVLLLFVISHLIENAVKYSHRGGTVDCQIGQFGKAEVMIQVADQGQGMDDKTKATIFDLDKPVPTGTSGEKGAGIGLLICRDFIARMEGRLEIRSKTGQGAVFSLYIPVKRNQGGK